MSEPTKPTSKGAGDFNSRKMVSFGDPSAAQGGLIWSFVSVAVLIALWWYFSGPRDVFWLPAMGEVWTKFVEMTMTGYRNAKGINPYPFIGRFYMEPVNILGFLEWIPLLNQIIPEVNVTLPVLHGHLWDSFYRILAGFAFGCLVGIPLGISMALSKVMKGLFDPIIELYRPVPPLAWAPLIIVIFGIDEDGKIILLFLAALSIMVISARAGATGVKLSKVHAAYSLGASRWQVLRHVILPNSMPEILTGMRVAMGVCWGTVVAAEMIGGISGVGFSVNFARKFFGFDIIWSGIILMGLVGLLIDLGMRGLIALLIPWRGKG